jgi:hypothetical protein
MNAVTRSPSCHELPRAVANCQTREGASERGRAERFHEWSVVEEGKVTRPDRGSPQGGMISLLLSNIFLHEIDGRWCRSDGVATGAVGLNRDADNPTKAPVARSNNRLQLIFGIESEVEVIEGLIRITKARLFAAALEQPVGPARELIRYEARYQIDGSHRLSLSLAQSRFEYRGHAPSRSWRSERSNSTRCTSHSRGGFGFR